MKGKYYTGFTFEPMLDLVQNHRSSTVQCTSIICTDCVCVCVWGLRLDVVADFQGDAAVCSNVLFEVCMSSISVSTYVVNSW